MRALSGASGSRKKVGVREVTPGYGTTATFAERALEQNSRFSGLDIMARLPAKRCPVVQMHLETYETVEVSAFSPDAAWLVYGGFTLRLVSVLRGEVIELLPLGLGLGVKSGKQLIRLRCTSFSWDSELMCAARGSELLVYELGMRSQLCTLRGAHAPLSHCAVAPRRGPNAAAAATEDGKIYLWRDVGVHGAQPPILIDGCAVGFPLTSPSQLLAFSGSQLLAGGANGLFACWDAEKTPSQGETRRLGDALQVVGLAPYVTPQAKPDGLSLAAVLASSTLDDMPLEAAAALPKLNGRAAVLASSALYEMPLDAAALPSYSAELSSSALDEMPLAPLLAVPARGERQGVPTSPNEAQQTRSFQGGGEGLGGDRSAGLPRSSDSAVLLCTEGGGAVHVRDARNGASLNILLRGQTGSQVWHACVGVKSAHKLLTLSGFHDAAIYESQSGSRLSSRSLGHSLGMAGWLSRCAGCALAPDDSAIVGLYITRHSATGVFLIRIDDVDEPLQQEEEWL